MTVGFFHIHRPIAGAVLGLGALGLVAAMAGVGGPALAAGAEPDARPTEPVSAPTNVWAISRGGQLYDNWAAVLELDPPERTHPAYPAIGKQTGAATWRCKECHGWDYKGVDGAYGRGAHFTGIKGVRGVQDVDPERIVAILRDRTHRYTESMIPPSAARKLALFLSLGQIDMDRYVDRATKQAHGNPLHGAQFFQTICANCHGFDGKEIDFSDEDVPEFVGTVATENPWEALHKIRFGQPGFPMVSLNVLHVQTQADILAYAQILPVE